MADYNYQNLVNSQVDMPNEEEPEKEPQFLVAFFAGLGASVIVGVVLALLGMCLEAEYTYALIFGAIVIGSAIKKFVPHKSIGGALLGLVLCPTSYFIYQVIMGLNGYEYEKNGEFNFWILLIGSAIFGACMGYNNKV